MRDRKQFAGLRKALARALSARPGAARQPAVKPALSLRAAPKPQGRPPQASGGARQASPAAAAPVSAPTRPTVPASATAPPPAARPQPPRPLPPSVRQPGSRPAPAPAPAISRQPTVKPQPSRPAGGPPAVKPSPPAMPGQPVASPAPAAAAPPFVRRPPVKPVPGARSARQPTATKPSLGDRAAGGAARFLEGLAGAPAGSLIGQGHNPAEMLRAINGLIDALKKLTDKLDRRDQKAPEPGVQRNGSFVPGGPRPLGRQQGTPPPPPSGAVPRTFDQGVIPPWVHAIQGTRPGRRVF